ETLLAIAICVLIAGCAMFLAPGERHWFLLPVTVCGILSARRGLTWFRADVDPFDPAALIGCLGVHLFFLAPILHVSWDQWMRYVDPPADWRTWLGWMGIANAAGLTLLEWQLSRPASQPRRTWTINPSRLSLFAIGGAVVCTAVQVWVYRQTGGVSGYIEKVAFDPALLRGYGPALMISEAAPILWFIAGVLAVRRFSRKSEWPMVAALLLVFLTAEMFLAGLRGSRSNVVWGVFWALGMVHVSLRRLP